MALFRRGNRCDPECQREVLLARGAAGVPYDRSELLHEGSEAVRGCPVEELVFGGFLLGGFGARPADIARLKGHAAVAAMLAKAAPAAPADAAAPGAATNASG